MALRRWVSLSRYDGAQMLIATQCPPDGRNCLVVRGYRRSNLGAYGFQHVAPGTWIADQPSFKTSDLKTWFPGFDPSRDLKDMETSEFLLDYEALGLISDETTIGALLARGMAESSPDAEASQPGTPSRDAIPATPDAGGKKQTYQERIAEIRASIPHDDIAAVVAEFPPEDATAPYTEHLDEKVRQFYESTGSASTRRARRSTSGVQSEIDKARDELALAVERYNDIRTKGADALSDYDIAVPYSGDAVIAVRQSLRLKQSHILYHRRQILVLEELAASMNDRSAPRTQAGEGSNGSEDIDPPASRRRGRSSEKAGERARTRIVDAGEKIGGARKDFFAKSMAAQDLASMNDREKLELVTRDNIWPRPSMDDFRQRGVDARVALFVLGLRRDLPASIGEAEQAENYLELVTQLRDISSTLSRKEDIDRDDWGHDKGSTAVYLRALERAGIIEVTRDDDRQWRSKRVASRYQEFLNCDTKHRRFQGDYLLTPARGYSRAKTAWDARAFRIGEEWVRPNTMNSDALYDFISAQKQASNEQRERTNAARATANKGDGAGNYLSRPHLDHLERTGLPDERGGRDISAADFLETFGFRACEFGNWLPDVERQDVLNRAFDSLATLTRVLGVPKSFISLEGTLAVAFGARGVGRAAAHYEPARKVINLTRLKGAGSLAHEFFHALDDHLGERVKTLVQRATHAPRITDSYYATELFLTQTPHGSGYRTNEIAQAGNVPAAFRDRLAPLVVAVNALSVRQRTEDEARTLAERNLAVVRGNIRTRIDNAIYRLQPSLTHSERQTQAGVFEQSAFEEIANDAAPRLRDGEHHPLVDRLGRMLTAARANVISAAHAREAREQIEKLSVDLDRLPQIHKLATDREALLASDYMSGRGLMNTDYYRHAEELDKGRSSKYWSTVRELGARAFEAYVQDRCTERGWRDDYLVHGTEEARFETADAPPFPIGDERKRIGDAFDGLVGLAKREFDLVDDAESEPTDVVSPIARPRAA